MIGEAWLQEETEERFRKKINLLYSHVLERLLLTPKGDHRREGVGSKEQMRSREKDPRVLLFRVEVG